MPTDNLSKPGLAKETISELAHRHMHDQNHHTTDEELANAELTVSAPASSEDEAESEAVPDPYEVLE